jgi:hypothetical protein
MLTPDWSETATIKKLTDGIGKKFKPGWTETETDTAFLEAVITLSGSEQLYRLSVWNRPGVRAELATMLGRPVHTS